MAKLIIDLTGRGGVADKFCGDIDQVTPQPQNRYLAGDSEMAQGIFNPFIRDGFLSPASNVFQPVTLDTTLNATIGSSIYDAINDDFYVAERGAQIFKGDGLSDTSLERQLNLTNSSVAIHDLDLYQINGTRKLFYVYKGGAAVANYTLSTTLNGSAAWVTLGGRINPVASTEPTLLYSKRDTVAGSGATQTVSIDVPAGSNKVLVVIAATYNTGTALSLSATWDGNAMTVPTSGAGGVSATFRWSIFYFIAPATKTGNVVVTYDAAVTNKVIHAFVFDNTHQTVPMNTQSGSGSSTTASLVATISAANQLPFYSVFSATSLHTPAGGLTNVFNADNTSGTDSADYFSMAAIRLRVGIASLPFASNDNDWLTSTTSGAFSDTITSNYAFMRLADNGYAYLFADNQVHKIDGTTVGGTNGTVTHQVLLFPSFFTLTDGVDYRGNMYMVIHQSTVDVTLATQTNYTVPCGVYIWDRLTTQVKMQDYVPVEGVRIIKRIYVSPTGSIRIICVASDGSTQVRELNGSAFKVIETLGIGAAPQYADGLLVAGLKTIWMGTDGNIYCHGDVGGKEVLAPIGQIRAPQAETTVGYSENIIAGALLFGFGTDTGTSGYRNDRQGLTLSYSVGTPLVKKFYPFDVSPVNSTNQTAHIGNIYTGVKLLPFMSTVNDITIMMAKGTATGTTVQATIKIYFNGSTTAWASKNVTRNDIAKGYMNIVVGKVFIQSIQIKIEYATGVTLSDTYDFHPFYADVNYEPTTAQTPIPRLRKMSTKI